MKVQDVRALAERCSLGDCGPPCCDLHDLARALLAVLPIVEVAFDLGRAKAASLEWSSANIRIRNMVAVLDQEESK